MPEQDEHFATQVVRELHEKYPQVRFILIAEVEDEVVGENVKSTVTMGGFGYSEAGMAMMLKDAFFNSILSEPVKETLTNEASGDTIASTPAPAGSEQAAPSA